MEKSRDGYEAIQVISENAFHDFKNILSTISGIAQLTMMKATSEEVRSNLWSINKATFDLRDIIDRYYIVTQGSNNHNLSLCSFTESIYIVLKIVKYKFDLQKMISRTIDLNVNIKSNSKVLCNDYDLKQSLLNIVMNAIESMEEQGGTLFIEVGDDSKFSYIEIVDTGVGISQENLDRLFKETFTTKEKGTGLGLRITRQAIEKFGGRLEITSQVGVGTKVKVFLPTYNE